MSDHDTKLHKPNEYRACAKVTCKSLDLHKDKNKPKCRVKIKIYVHEQLE